MDATQPQLEGTAEPAPPTPVELLADLRRHVAAESLELADQLTDDLEGIGDHAGPFADQVRLAYARHWWSRRGRLPHVHRDGCNQCDAGWVTRTGDQGQTVVRQCRACSTTAQHPSGGRQWV